MPDADLNHPPTERLTEFAQGRLSDTDLAAIGAHLAQCDACCQALQLVSADDL